MVRINFSEFAWCLSDHLVFGVGGILFRGGDGVRLASCCKVTGGIAGSFSSTIAGLNEMSPVLLYPDRIVERLKIGPDHPHLQSLSK